MEKSASFTLAMELIQEAKSEYENPLRSEVRLIFTDDQPNANGMGIKKDEFESLIQSMKLMPIKAYFSAESSGLGGHAESTPVGVIAEGKVEGNKILAIGSLWKAECPELIEYFKGSMAEGKQIGFSWEVYYKDSVAENGTNWLKDVTTRAITAVQNPAYEGRTALLAISSIDLLAAINAELKERGEE